MQDKAYLLVNLGTPEAPTTEAVREYLVEFLMDDEVIDIPYLARLALVYGIIGPFRSPKSAKAYQSIWMREGSPLLHYSKQFMDKLRDRYSELPLFFACRYGKPSIHSVLSEIQEKGFKKLQVIPLYPQYATSTWRTLEKKIPAVLSKLKYQPQLSIQKPFFNEEAYLNAVSDVASQHLSEKDHLVFSFHGIPVKQCSKPVSNIECKYNNSCCMQEITKSDKCYRAHCYWTAKNVAAKLELPEDRWSLAFQSRLGRAEWLEPQTIKYIEEVYKRGHKNLAVICPSFVVDCLETLEEVNVEMKERWLELGGETFKLIPCLNADDGWVEAAHKLITNDNLQQILSEA